MCVCVCVCVRACVRVCVTTTYVTCCHSHSYVFYTQLSLQYLPTAAEVTISNLTLASRTATTLSVTWSAGYPKCYSFTVSHSTQDGSIPVTQPADSDTSHTLTSLQPGTTYRIEVEVVRKGDGADGQRAKVMGNFTTEGKKSNIFPYTSCMHYNYYTMLLIIIIMPLLWITWDITVG